VIPTSATDTVDIIPPRNTDGERESAQRRRFGRAGEGAGGGMNRWLCIPAPHRQLSGCRPQEAYAAIGPDILHGIAAFSRAADFQNGFLLRGGRLSPTNARTDALGKRHDKSDEAD
jgi:hypothetical protein